MRKNHLSLAVAMLAMASVVGCSRPAAQDQAAQDSSTSAAASQSAAGSTSSRTTSARSFPERREEPTRSAPVQPAVIRVPAGTELHVVLDQTISSATAHSGDPFDASLIQPVVVRGTRVIPRDARVRGHLANARASGRLSGVAELVLTLDSVTVGGRRYDIQTSSVTRRGSSHKKRDLVAIGGGSALGALIGGIAGGGKGAAIGAAAGAGAGTAGAAATGKKNIELPAEDRLVFSLRAPLEIHQ